MDEKEIKAWMEAVLNTLQGLKDEMVALNDQVTEIARGKST